MMLRLRGSRPPCSPPKKLHPHLPLTSPAQPLLPPAKVAQPRVALGRARDHVGPLRRVRSGRMELGLTIGWSNGPIRQPRMRQSK